MHNYNVRIRYNDGNARVYAVVAISKDNAIHRVLMSLRKSLRDAIVDIKASTHAEDYPNLQVKDNG